MTRLLNNFKTAMLLAALFGLLVTAGYFLGGAQGMIIAGVFATLMNFGAWFFSDRIAVAAMRGREVDRAKRAELPMPRVYICPQEAPNAFATGRNPRHAAVAVTQGALRLLDDAELEGVIGHELAHIRNRDTLTSTIAATVAGIFSMLAQFALFFGFGRGSRDANPLAMLGVVILGAIGAALIKAMISRSREFVADADGARIAGSPHGLASALRKLESYAKRVPMQNPNPAMNNLFIVEPFVGKTLTNLFATHPPTEKRIAALMAG
jgi:heat shock protein HtpX